MHPILALSATDYGVLAAALVTIIGAISAGAVAIIKAIKGTDVAAQARHDETMSKLP